MLLLSCYAAFRNIFQFLISLFLYVCVWAVSKGMFVFTAALPFRWIPHHFITFFMPFLSFFWWRCLFLSFTLSRVRHLPFYPVLYFCLSVLYCSLCMQDSLMMMNHPCFRCPSFYGLSHNYCFYCAAFHIYAKCGKVLKKTTLSIFWTIALFYKTIICKCKCKCKCKFLTFLVFHLV